MDKEYLGHICTVMMLNEMEIIAWCYTIYLILNRYDEIEAAIGQGQINTVKFINPEELVLACAIFSKVSHTLLIASIHL